MIVHPALPAARQQLDDARCRELLDQLMGNRPVERSALLSASVPLHRVNALYPLKLQTFVGAVAAAFESYGAGHLRADVVTQQQWWNAIRLAERVKDALSATDRRAFYSVWRDNIQGEAAQQVAQRVKASLASWHIPADAVAFSDYSVRILCTLHWFAANSLAVAAGEPEDLRELRLWVVNVLLPSRQEAVE